MFDFGAAQHVDEGRVAKVLAPSADDRSGLPFIATGAEQQGEARVENNLGEICCRVRHDCARSDSYGTICSVLFLYLLWGRSMKRFMVVPVMATSGWIRVFVGFLPFPVFAYTIRGHIRAELAGFPAMGALLSGGVVGVYETGVREL